MKKSRFLIFLVGLVLIASIATTVLYHRIYIERIVEVDIEVTIGETIGINADPGSLNFGTIPPLADGERYITLENNASHPVKLVMSTSGEVAPWVKIEENNFILEPKESKEVTIRIFPPQKEFGVYKGKLKAVFKKVW